MHSIPEFTRIQWVSKKAEEVWAPRFSKVCKISNQQEIHTVLNGKRRIAMPNLSLEAFNSLYLDKSYKARLLSVHAAPEIFHTVVQPFVEGEPFTLRTVIGTDKWTSCFIEAWGKGDQGLCGRLLGYPKCCTKNFMKRWVGEGILDFTWDMMEVQNNLNTAVIDPRRMLSPFYSRFGIRPIWHMPCSIRCQESASLADKYLESWPDDERKWLYEILGWPVEWDSVHGAAEIRTPVCKIIQDTIHSHPGKVIQFPGHNRPKEAATGNRFPYAPEAELHSNNGFTTREGMNEAHDMILQVAKAAKDVKGIMDPGCGNGLLLEKLSDIHPEATLSGVDKNHHAVTQGRHRFGLRLDVGDLFNYYSSADMVVFMPGRLLEQPDQAEMFVSRLKFRYLLLYGYSAYAHKVWDLITQHWPELNIVSVANTEQGLAVLLERPK